jgi:copper chaperone NosL
MALLLLALTACGSEASADPTPPTIHYGEDICEFCGMIVSEERYAAGYITPAGETRIFDDIGDMVQAHLQDQEEEAAALFVHDYNDHTWIRAETAHYLHSPNLPTPMLSGLAAFPTAAEANSLADELGGQILTFDELLSHYGETLPSPAFSGRGGE